MEPIVIACFQCLREFVFPVEEQLRYRHMNFDEPRRCPDCRKKKMRPHAFQNERHKHKQKFYRLQFED
jgi:NAD-dependent SIR2 family protein deacetylase